MEQTDVQFKAYIRFLRDALLEISQEADEKKRKVKMEKVMGNLQKVLED